MTLHDPDGPAAAPARTADTILTGGQVHAMDAAGTVHQAVALAGGRVLAVGTAAAVAGLAGPDTAVIDMRGGAVLPGINDAHLHGAWLGARWPALMLEAPGPAWHAPTLTDRAAREGAIRRVWQILAPLGITSYTEPGLGPGEDAGATGCFGTDVLEAYAALAGSPAQTARVTVLRLFGLLDGPSRLGDFLSGLDTPAPAADPHWLAIAGVKIFADGIPPLGSAWTHDAYRDGSFGGLMTGTGDAAARLAAFEAMVVAAHDRGLQVGVHATGDATVEAFVSLIERLGGAGHRRHYVIHGDMATEAQIARMARAGIGIALQPLIAARTRDWLTGAVRPEVAARMWPMSAMLADGLCAAITSDAPVVSPDWRQSVAAMAALLAARGVAADRSVTLRLLRMVTALPAVQDGAAAWKGTIAPGMAADLCVLEADPFETGPAALPGLAVTRTIVAGRTVFAA